MIQIKGMTKKVAMETEEEKMRRKAAVYKDVEVVLVRVAAVLATLSPEEIVVLAGAGAIPAEIRHSLQLWSVS